MDKFKEVEKLMFKNLNKKINLSEQSLIVIQKVLAHFQENDHDLDLTTEFMRKTLGSSSNAIEIISESLIFYKNEINKE